MKIMVLEDVSIIRKRLCNVIKKCDSSHKIEEIYEVDNHDDSIKCLESNNIDIVFLDIDLNHIKQYNYLLNRQLDGIDVAKYILKNNSEIKIVMVSGGLDRLRIAEIVELGIQYIVSKPFMEGDILEICKNLSSEK